jgi:CxxC-x17-CxxC domain-containing protein
VAFKSHAVNIRQYKKGVFMEDESKDRFGREMHKVKCSDCGKDTDVPFKPSGDRPVYCRECYQKHRPRRRF